jgi:hypothetical protein
MQNDTQSIAQDISSEACIYDIATEKYIPVQNRENYV